MKINNVILGLGLIVLPLHSCNSQPKNTESKTSTAKAATAQTIEHLTAVSFKEKVFNYEVNKEWKFVGNKPAIIDFYADWCGPCKMVAPTLIQIANQYQGKVNVYKVNVDNEKELASAFGIQSIPTILFIPMAEKPQASTGVLSKADFEKAIKEVLKVN
jgi:thioredoxin